MDDGDLCFVTELYTSSISVEIGDIKHLIAANLFTFDRHYDVIMKVIHGGMSPKAALALAEENPAETSHQPRFNFN
jgi:hypothetical protein